MSFLSKAKELFGKTINKDLFQAIIAAGMLVSAADGDISDDEVSKLKILLKTDGRLKAFGETEIDSVINQYAERLKASFDVGKLSLLKEISDVKDDPEEATLVFVIALAISKTDGEIGAKELSVLKIIASRLGVNINNPEYELKL